LSLSSFSSVPCRFHLRRKLGSSELEMYQSCRRSIEHS
jgi:hypothetical protein